MKKLIAIIVILVVIVNMVLFALQKVNQLVFWGIIILAAIFAFKILPKLKN